MNKLRSNLIRRGVWHWLFVLALITCGCAKRVPKFDPTYTREIEQWHQERWQELNGENGWLTLVGLFWLKEGSNKAGSDFPALDIVLPKDKVPQYLGDFILDKGVVSLDTPEKDKFRVEGRPFSQLQAPSKTPKVEGSIKLNSDADNKPTILRFGSLSFQIIKRGDKFALRVKDAMNPDRLNFNGTEFYPADLNWRINARFAPYTPPKPMPIMNVLGMESAESSPGAIVFALDGQEYRLDAMIEKGDQRLFMLIGDQTNGKTSYPAGRYLYVDPPDASGQVIIDFNKAFSPPCAFTRFATCPLPPKQNRLPIEIEAGEKYVQHAK